jgi:hypothetical protein
VLLAFARTIPAARKGTLAPRKGRVAR